MRSNDFAVLAVDFDLLALDFHALAHSLDSRALADSCFASITTQRPAAHQNPLRLSGLMLFGSSRGWTVMHAHVGGMRQCQWVIATHDIDFDAAQHPTARIQEDACEIRALSELAVAENVYFRRGRWMPSQPEEDGCASTRATFGAYFEMLKLWKKSCSVRIPVFEHPEHEPPFFIGEWARTFVHRVVPVDKLKPVAASDHAIRAWIALYLLSRFVAVRG